MAKYNDYVNETIETEIDDASAATASRQTELPEQFQGKTAEEIAQSYNELKAMSDRQANELGEARKAHNQLLEQTLSIAPDPEPITEPDPITIDDLYDGTEEAISRVVDKRVNDRLDRIEQATAKTALEQRLEKLEEDFPDYENVARSPEMQNWLQGSRYRQRMAEQVRAGDVDAAEELFAMYYDLNGKPTGSDAPTPAEAGAELESGGNAGTMGGKSAQTFSSSKIINAKRDAKRGDDVAIQWLRENNSAIMDAYREGRIVD